MRAANIFAHPQRRSSSDVASAWLTGRANWHLAPRMTRWRVALRASLHSQSTREFPPSTAFRRRKV